MEYTYAIFILGVTAFCVQGCTDFDLKIPTRDPKHGELDEQKVFYSEHVVFGTVLKDATGTDFPHKDVKGVRTIEFAVICSYKGEQLPKRIFITGVGNRGSKGLKGCPPANVTNKENVLMFLKKLNKTDLYEVEYKPVKGDSSVFMDDISMVCGLTLEFPVGKTTENEIDEVCQEPLSVEEECVPYIEPTPAPPSNTTTAQKVTPTPKVVVKVTETDDSEEVKPEPEDEGYNTKKENPGAEKTGGATGESSASSISMSVLLFVISTLAIFLV